MKSKQNNRNGPKVPDVKKQSKMAKHGHKHPVVMGGINNSGSLTPPPKTALKSSNALRGR